MDEYPMNSKCYEMGEVIGIGLRSVVHKAYCISKQFCVVAIKIIEFHTSVEDMEMKMVDTQKSGANMAMVEREARAVHTLVTHPNILKPHCIFTVAHSLWVVMPFLSGGSLLSVMADSGHGLSEECIAPLLKGICSALCHLHRQGHIHGDVKPGNILLDSDGSVTLGDLGFSTLFCGSNDPMECETPLYWVAPEEVVSIGSDIWSFGITALELAHGSPPLSLLPPCKSIVINCKSFIKRVNRRFGFVDRFDSMYLGSCSSSSKMEFSECFKNMVALCLSDLCSNNNKPRRLSAEELMEHEFFKNCQGPGFLIKNIVDLGIVRWEFNDKKFQMVAKQEVTQKVVIVKEEVGDD